MGSLLLCGRWLVWLSTHQIVSLGARAECPSVFTVPGTPEGPGAAGGGRSPLLVGSLGTLRGAERAVFNHTHRPAPSPGAESTQSASCPQWLFDPLTDTVSLASPPGLSLRPPRALSPSAWVAVHWHLGFWALCFLKLTPAGSVVRMPGSLRERLQTALGVPFDLRDPFSAGLPGSPS